MLRIKRLPKILASVWAISGLKLQQKIRCLEILKVFSSQQRKAKLSSTTSVIYYLKSRNTYFSKSDCKIARLNAPSSHLISYDDVEMLKQKCDKIKTQWRSERPHTGERAIQMASLALRQSPASLFLFLSLYLSLSLSLLHFLYASLSFVCSWIRVLLLVNVCIVFCLTSTVANLYNPRVVIFDRRTFIRLATGVLLRLLLLVLVLFIKLLWARYPLVIMLISLSIFNLVFELSDFIFHVLFEIFYSLSSSFKIKSSIICSSYRSALLTQSHWNCLAQDHSYLTYLPSYLPSYQPT